jgi:hypothetical protein
MGHLANAKGFRVGKTVPWDFTTHNFSFDKFYYQHFFFNFYKYIRSKFLSRLKPLVFGLLFSHLQVRNYFEKTFVKSVVFNSFYDVYTRRLKHFFKFNRKNKKLPSFIKQFRYNFESNLYYWENLKKWFKNDKKINGASFRALAYFISKRINYDLRNIYSFNKVINFFEHRRFVFITARLIAEYIVRRFRLKYTLNRIVYPLLKEAKQDKKFKGFYLKFKGRLTRKPRVVVNKRVFKLGKIGFSTVVANVDYFLHRFETRFGTCSIKIWICRH